MGTIKTYYFLSFTKISRLKSVLSVPCRYSNNLPNKAVEKHRRSSLNSEPEPYEPTPNNSLVAPRDYKFVYPEFLPEPNNHRRDRIREKLEHDDMYKRRLNINIPEFYVGSIMAVVVSDPHAPGRRNRFVGLCIQRSGHGLRANFTLRNVVDTQGMEITYEMYNPTLQSIDVLKLEKRLDESLYYLRDAPPEYSTVPFDYESVPHPPGAPVPVNPLKVKLKGRPWHERWERQNLKGIHDLELPQRIYDRAAEPDVAEPWKQCDLMEQYRNSINEDEAKLIMDNVYRRMTQVEEKIKSRWSKKDS